MLSSFARRKRIRFGFFFGSVANRPVGLIIATLLLPPAAFAQSSQELNRRGAGAYARADYAAARDLFERALQAASDGQCHLRGPILANLAATEKRQGKLDESAADYRAALDCYAPDSTTYAVTLNNLAEVHRETGETQYAAMLYRRAIRILTSHPEAERDLAAARNNLGVALAELGRYREAEEQLESALTLKHRIYGPNHHEVAVTEQSLAAMRRTNVSRRDTVDVWELMRK